MRVVVAPDKFKGCLTAAGVAQALAAGLCSGPAQMSVTLLPVADGGDGTVAAALAAGFREVRVEVAGPTGEPVAAPYAMSGTSAVVELAAACGLDLLPDGFDPLGASTFGLGQVVSDAIDRGATDVVVGIGGSASTDGGAGLLQALGARVRDEAGSEIGRGGGALESVATVELAGLAARIAGVRFRVACDVDNPLLGPRGATAVFAPQKGAGPDDRVILERGLARWAERVEQATGADHAGEPGAGAAGGAGFAALAVLGATLAPGIDLVLDLLDFAGAVRGADLVVTGEGSLDEQSLAGKAPVGVARAAAAAGVATVAVAGRSLLRPDRHAAAGFSAVYPLSELEPDVNASMANAAELLTAVGRRIAAEWGLYQHSTTHRTTTKAGSADD